MRAFLCLCSKRIVSVLTSPSYHNMTQYIRQQCAVIYLPERQCRISEISLEALLGIGEVAACVQENIY